MEIKMEARLILCVGEHKISMPPPVRIINTNKHVQNNQVLLCKWETVIIRAGLYLEAAHGWHTVSSSRSVVILKCKPNTFK